MNREDAKFVKNKDNVSKKMNRPLKASLRNTTRQVVEGGIVDTWERVVRQYVMIARPVGS